MATYLKEIDITCNPCPLTFKIADLGESKILTEQQTAYTRVGNPLVMAPEGIFGEGYDHKYDVWALGSLFYKMVVGFVPFLTDRKNEESDEV